MVYFDHNMRYTYINFVIHYQPVVSAINSYLVGTYYAIRPVST